ncbi:urotensin-2-like [Brachionichthys hirsutus]|uniref:urotensin-2-like n=1 Tax=Brachionichthys hirsutus TaxID=412623 RepID=UPI003604EAA6
MKWNHLLSWAFLLLAGGPLLAHPLTESAEMPYLGPVSTEDELKLSEQTFPLRDGQRYSVLTSGEINRDGIRTTGLLPRGMKREVLLEKQSLLNPLRHMLATRKQLWKRAGNSDCFWKYCF